MACASHTRLPEPIRAGISARYTGRTVELRQSMYYGDLYDENEKWLLSPYPFAETFHIVDTKGEPIHPQGQRGIIPAGTSFLVYRIEFPDVAAMATRMLTTPRYNPWIYLTAPEGSNLPQGRKHFILLLPMDLDTESAVEQEIAELLGSMGEVQKWLEKRKPTVRVAIEHKDVIPGMTLDEVIAAMGEPQRWFTGGDGLAVKVAWYPSKELWLEDGAVKEVKPARPAEPTPAARPTSAPAGDQPTTSR